MIAPAQRTERAGIIPGAAQLAIDAVDRSQSTMIALVQDVRTELRVAIEGGLDLGEKTVVGMFRIAKKLTQRIDDGVGETLGAIELLLGSSLRTRPTNAS